MPTDPAVAVRDLVKRYPKRPVNAVDGVSFHVTAGEVFGLLGPNGAGKTTTIGVLTTRVVPTSGSAQVSGVDVRREPVAARARLAVVPQRPNLDRSLTARQNLVFHAAYHGVPRAERNRRADELLEQFGLGDRGGGKVDQYSGGLAQRLMIARALMHTPDVLFLDEPSTGLDPQARLFVWDRIRELRAAGVTILLTTHDMDEAAELADRVGIMDHGRLLALDTPAALTRSLPGSATLEVGARPADHDDADGLVSALGTLSGVERAEPVHATDGAGPAGFGLSAPPDDPEPSAADGAVRVRLYVGGEPAGLLGPVARLLVERGAALTDARVGAPSLEDVFINLTGRGLR
jgi:ABC-2 type transport system ATP-binding protein